MIKLLIILSIISLICAFIAIYSNIKYYFTKESCISQYHKLQYRLLADNEDFDIILKDADELFGRIEMNTILNDTFNRDRKLFKKAFETRLKKVKKIPKSPYMSKRQAIIDQYDTMINQIRNKNVTQDDIKQIHKKMVDIWFEIRNDYALRGATIEQREKLKYLLNLFKK
ncbi:MAG: hypothetical protein Q4D02_06445 [Clostridia bacterium]|nr:hypothetical protein [Clostridia bacterium]